jgi:glycosyltransferase involved in cell wall biosynthesis
MSDFVAILDYRGIIWKDKNALIRHESYAEELFRKYGQALVILTTAGGNEEYSSNLKYLKLHNLGKIRFINFQFLLNSRIFLKNQGLNCKLLIAGDPWENALIAIFLNYQRKKKIPMQVQVHGDIANTRWIRFSWRNKLRSLVSGYTLTRATRVRCVGKSQADLILDKYQFEKFKIDVIEVPMDLTHNQNHGIAPKEVTIGFLGRLSEDRGIGVFIELIYKIAQVRADFRVVVAGDGTLKNEFEDELVDILGKQRVLFLGNLESTKLHKFWNQISILVSTAPAESFGRSIREAILADKPVWAVKTSGVTDLMFELKQDELLLLDPSLSADELSSQFQNLLSCSISPTSKKLLWARNATAIPRLIESWGSTQKIEA